jgi:putative transposase
MKDAGSLSHTKWECKYPVVFIPKYRCKAMYKELRQYLREVFYELARQKECRIEEGNLCSDHVHMLISIPPKHSVSQVVGFFKGKSAYAFGGEKLYAIARNYGGKRKNFVGVTFLGAGVLRLNGGTRRSNGATIHPTTGSGRSTHRPENCATLHAQSHLRSATFIVRPYIDLLICQEPDLNW